MASSERLAPAPFVRGSAQRSSLPPTATRHSGGGSASKDTSAAVEAARQHALHAAELYHQQVLLGRSPGDGEEPDSNRATPTTDAYYKQKLQTGFITLRNSYNEKRPRPKMTTQYRTGTGTLTFQPSRPLQRVQENSPPRRIGGAAGGHRISPPKYGHRATLAERRGLYRSNSSLELENIDYIDSDQVVGGGQFPPGSQRGGGAPLGRDYGSANSLDMMGVTNAGESFFAMLQDYRNENLDQRAPAPPQVHELLRGQAPADSVDNHRAYKQQQQPQPQHLPQYQQQHQQLQRSTHNLVVSNGAVPAVVASDPVSTGSTDTQDGGHVGPPPASPKAKSKSLKQSKRDKKERTKSVVSEASSGILKKLRGTKSDPNSVQLQNSDSSSSMTDAVCSEERQRRKAFVHYDCQSLGVNFAEMIERRRANGCLGIRPKNVTTGASAASRVSALASSSASAETGADEDNDHGDGKSNDLVLSCPFFRNEVGSEEERTLCLNRATAQKQVQQLLGNKQVAAPLLLRRPVCNGLSVLDPAPGPHGTADAGVIAHRGLVLEYVDQGAMYYRNFFMGLDHQNFFGVEESLGPVAVSIRRERLDEKDRETPNGRVEAAGHCWQYRIIVRTSQLTTLRGCILEEAIPSSSRLSNTKGLPAKEVLEYVLPDLNLSPCLKAAQTLGSLKAAKTQEQLAKLDEQGVSKTYKFGVMYCRAAQSSEEDMYNNEHAGPLFDDFLECLGEKVQLNGFQKYRGGLDCKTDSTGTHSLFAEFHGYEIMFHVSTMLPYTATNRQQLLRKRHIGNDIVTIIFQEPGALPFTPQNVRSHFQHVFIIVRCNRVANNEIKYSLAVTRSKDVPTFGPHFTDGALFKRGADFAEFLLTKAINAENAVHRSEKFAAMATRTREEYLKDLATNYVTTTALDSGSKLAKFALGSGRKKEKLKVRTFPDMFAKGALVWNVQAEDFGLCEQLSCLLGISANYVVLMELAGSRDVVFTCLTQAVIGWTSNGNSLRLYYDRGESIAMRTIESDVDEILEIVTRLEHVTHGCETQEMTLRRNNLGQLGFHVLYEGIVSDVENYGLAWKAGLRSGSRLVQICTAATATLTHNEMIDLLRTSVQVNVIVIPPNDDGTPRRGVDDPLSAPPSIMASAITDHIASDDDSASSRSTVLSASRNNPQMRYESSRYNTPPRNMVPAAAPPQSNPTSVGYSAPAYSSGGASLISHAKQSSQDSVGSGRSSGHGSEGRSSAGGGAGGQTLAEERRFDTLSSEGFFSGDDRGGEKDRGAGAKAGPLGGKDEGWAGKVTIYPAYKHDDPGPGGSWVDHHHPADHQFPGNAYLSKSQPAMASYRSAAAAAAFSPGSQSNLSAGSGGSVRGASGSRVPAYGASPREGGGLPRDTSTTSLSGSADLGSSGGSGGGVSKGYRADDSHTSRDEARPPPNTISPAGRHRQVAFAGASARRQPHLDSPHSNNSSPRSNQRGVAGSDENLVAMVSRARAATSLKVNPTSSGASTFQEDLMRLINPDISFTESDKDDRSVNSAGSMGGGSSSRRHPGGGAGGGGHRQLSRLQRAQSDESICGGAKSPAVMRRRADAAGTGAGLAASDVIFTTAVPAHVTGKQPARSVDNADHRLSPRATTTSSSQRLAASTLASSNPSLPLPTADSRLDWDNLVETATKAFEGGELANKDGVKSSKSMDMAASAAKAGTAAAGDRAPAPASSANRQASTWLSRGAESAAVMGERIAELEQRCQQLERQLQHENVEKESLEAEVSQLRQENLQLQEESQTAAAQLRRFTEWFFQTIDRQ